MFPSHTPPPITWNIPEFAFLGRSNVGKSTLIKSLLHSLSGVRKIPGKTVPHVGKKPGKTTMVNYYGTWSSTVSDETVDNADYYMVDLPGYGFASTVDEGTRRGWDKRTRRYLTSRANPDWRTGGGGGMRNVFLLIDGRRGVGGKDREVMEWMEDNMLEYSIVVTKVDALGKLERIRAMNEAGREIVERNRGRFGWCRREVIGVSGKGGEGVEDIVKRMEVGWE
ncbi:hypothetical protein TrCOL_g6418 [Triparma columacea]|uniref:EngB-type G domain-containing protein n=1 Tax=Triparma columacea TaxID=722753 RepID=A0A9W7GNJ0_9STRA|nr:hypothetical protein TrCOL_g6418 [Triparma columacea]